jgi:hypothetical protein
MEITIKIARIEDTTRVQASLIALAPKLAKGKVFECSIRQFVEKRGIDANAYFHVLCDKIAKALKSTMEEVKVRMVLDYGTIDTDIDGEPVRIKARDSVKIENYFEYSKLIGKEMVGNVLVKTYLIYKRTRDLNTKEMSQLIEGTISEAKELGIETKTPNEIAQMMSLWGGANG